ncbi:hypothetical protein D3C76_02210 [compost metagenome]
MEQTIERFYKKILKSLGLKTLPIMFWPVVLPIMFVFIVSLVLYTLSYKIAGFWRCDNCKKLSWANKEKYKARENDHDEWPDYHCEACHIAKELTKKK